MQNRNHYKRVKKGSAKKHEQLIDRVCSVFAVLMPLTSIPQIVLLYSTKDAGSLSLLMWILYCIGCVPFLLFGIIHRHLHLIVLNSLWLVAQGTIIVGILLYR